MAKHLRCQRLPLNHTLAGYGLQFEVKVLSVEDPTGEETGSDDVVVPGFLGLADKIVSEEDDDELPPLGAEAQEPDDSSMARLARPPRIVR